MPVTMVESQNDSIAFLTASRRWYIDTDSPIVISQTTSLVTMTAWERPGVEFYLVTFATAQQLIDSNGTAAFSGFALNNPSNGAEIKTTTVGAGQYYVYSRYTGTLAQGQTIEVYSDISYLQIQNETSVGSFSMAVSGNPGAWQAQQFHVTGNPNIYVKGESGLGRFAVMTDEQYQVFRSNSGQFPYLYNTSTGFGTPTDNLQGTFNLGPGSYWLVWQNNTSTWAGGGAYVVASSPFGGTALASGSQSNSTTSTGGGSGGGTTNPAFSGAVSVGVTVTTQHLFNLTTGTNNPDVIGYTFQGTLGNDTVSYTGVLRGSVYGNNGDDHITTAGGGDALYGEDGNDTLISNDNGDHLYGGVGNDSLSGGAGGDSLTGGGGRDTISGGLDRDTITADAGSSSTDSTYLRGDDGDDSITGGAGFDDINGNMGNDTASGGLGADWVVGGKDDDRLNGNDGDDIVYGNLGNDSGSGDVGNDLIRGGQGNDTLAGGAGNDWISGDRDNDTMSGGTGADIFHSFAGSGIDRVLDFNRAEGDRVQIDVGSTWTLAQVGADTVITFGGEGGQMILVGVSLASLAGDWIFTL